MGGVECRLEIQRRTVTCQWKGRSTFPACRRMAPLPISTKQSPHTKHTPGSQLKVEYSSVKGEREAGGGGSLIRVGNNSGNSVQHYSIHEQTLPIAFPSLPFPSHSLPFPSLPHQRARPRTTTHHPRPRPSPAHATRPAPRAVSSFPKPRPPSHSTDSTTHHRPTPH